jgi:hypothetical protein
MEDNRESKGKKDAQAAATTAAVRGTGTRRDNENWEWLQPKEPQPEQPRYVKRRNQMMYMRAEAWKRETGQLPLRSHSK